MSEGGVSGDDTGQGSFAGNITGTDLVDMRSGGGISIGGGKDKKDKKDKEPVAKKAKVTKNTTKPTVASKPIVTQSKSPVKEPVAKPVVKKPLALPAAKTRSGAIVKTKPQLVEV